MTPAERLLAAADLLDLRASEATEGPWTPEGEVHELDSYTGYDVDAGAGFVARLATEADARYIATVHPEVGKRIAAWLRWEADYEADWALAALDLADLVLAGEQEQARTE